MRRGPVWAGQSEGCWQTHGGGTDDAGLDSRPLVSSTFYARRDNVSKLTFHRPVIHHAAETFSGKDFSARDHEQQQQQQQANASR